MAGAWQVRRFGASLLQGTSEIFTEVSKTVVGEIEKAGKGNKREPRARGGRAAMAAVNGKYSRFETEVCMAHLAAILWRWAAGMRRFAPACPSNRERMLTTPFTQGHMHVVSVSA